MLFLGDGDRVPSVFPSARSTYMGELANPWILNWPLVFVFVKLMFLFGGGDVVVPALFLPFQGYGRALRECPRRRALPSPPTSPESAS